MTTPKLLPCPFQAAVESLKRMHNDAYSGYQRPKQMIDKDDADILVYLQRSVGRPNDEVIGKVRARKDHMFERFGSGQLIMTEYQRGWLQGIEEAIHLLDAEVK